MFEVGAKMLSGGCNSGLLQLELFPRGLILSYIRSAITHFVVFLSAHFVLL